MTRAERRTLAATGAAGALIAGVAGVLYGFAGGSLNHGAYAQGFDGVFYDGSGDHRLYSFEGRFYSGRREVAYAAFREIVGAALLGLLAGLIIGAVAVVRSRGLPRTRRRLALASAAGLVAGLAGCFTGHLAFPATVHVTGAAPIILGSGRQVPTAWWLPLLGALCGLGLGLLAGNEKRAVTTTE